MQPFGLVKNILVEPVKKYVTVLVEKHVDRDVYRRVETLKEETWKTHLLNKEEQERLLREAAEKTDDQLETRRLQKLAAKVGREKLQIELENQFRHERLNAFEEIALRRK